jgi:hypothetical protein
LRIACSGMLTLSLRLLRNPRIGSGFDPLFRPSLWFGQSPLDSGGESGDCGICDSPELFLASQILARTIAHDCWQWRGNPLRSMGATIRSRPEACRSRLDRQSVPDNLSLPPGLIDIPPPGFPAFLSKTSVPKLIDIHCPESIPVATIKGISLRPRMQSAQLSQLVAVNPSVIMVAVDVVVISGTQRAP